MAKQLLIALILVMGVATTIAVGSVQCPADLDGDESVGTADLLILFAQWGTDPGGPPDFDGNGTVDTNDLLSLFANWGQCPIIVGIRMEGDLTVAFIATIYGQEFAAVAFDPETGEDDFSTQRFLGLNETELLDIEDTGDPAPLQTFEAEAAGNLWSTGIPGDFTPLELGVLSRQSQLLSVLRDVVLPLSSTKPTKGECACLANNCTLVPDFDFADICNKHDTCICLSGSQLSRLACDATLGAKIIDQGYPDLGFLYFAGVRAFGWEFFVEGPRLGACCIYGAGCSILSQADCLRRGGALVPDMPCMCGPYGPYGGAICPYGYGFAQLFGQQRPSFAFAAMLTVIGLLGFQMAVAAKKR